ncbi:MAG TPA: hypothetical protein VKA31_10245 [Mariprofundaceae bacterium]|nr:hypothetical protein [Mariprofundaceae bacterium]
MPSVGQERSESADDLADDVDGISYSHDEQPPYSDKSTSNDQVDGKRFDK